MQKLWVRVWGDKPARAARAGGSNVILVNEGDQHHADDIDPVADEHLAPEKCLYQVVGFDLLVYLLNFENFKLHFSVVLGPECKLTRQTK